MEILRSEVIPDVVMITPEKFRDVRGELSELYNKEKYSFIGNHSFVQTNFSYSVVHTLRGLHYQIPPYEQGKLVTCIEGVVFDVAVDLRLNSATFGEWVGFELYGSQLDQVWIPPGFAHGFYAPLGHSHIMYQVTSPYYKPAERTLIWNDIDVDIDWGIRPMTKILMSEKDKVGFSFRDVAEELERIENG